MAVDESIIVFKGRSVLKQYNPMKPIKRGYKLWCLADQWGYVKSFDIQSDSRSPFVRNFLISQNRMNMKIGSRL
jgi:hypothetical protein